MANKPKKQQYNIVVDKRNGKTFKIPVSPPFKPVNRFKREKYA